MANTAPGGQLEDQLRSMILSNNVLPQDKNETKGQPAGPVGTHQNKNYRASALPQQPHSIYQINAQILPRQQEPVINHTQLRNVILGHHNQQHPQPQTSTSHARVPTPQGRSNTNIQPNNRDIQQTRPRGNGYVRGSFRSAPSKFIPLSRPQPPSFDHFNSQCQYLEQIAAHWLPQLELSEEEFASKDRFRIRLEQACQQAALTAFTLQPPTVRLASFGSLSSGFATPGSDMDLALVTSQSTPELPRLFEKALLELGHGARLLTRTRVPIIKVCESPSPELYAALLEERQKWDSMTVEEQINYDQVGRQDDEIKEEGKKMALKEGGAEVEQNAEDDELHKTEPKKSTKRSDGAIEDPQKLNTNFESQEAIPSAELFQQPGMTASDVPQASTPLGSKPVRPQRPQRAWYREKRLGPLDFPKSGVGIQCDINFSNPLGLHNTLLLRCYSHCDIRVRLMVLFIKAWASRRKINSGYNGTLSSYGYVLMVLHYLVNVVQPPVCPNLQLARRTDASWNPPAGDPNALCEGCDVRFWRNEAEILALAAKGMLSHNQQPLGVLLRGFFHYYSQQNIDAPNGGFMWTQQVLSLRTPGGLLSKEAKGWTGAKTLMQDKKAIRNRYLFAIEDPFELDHNVARTVTHNGIVAIRDEFRRAWRILIQASRGMFKAGDFGISAGVQDGDLFAQVEDMAPPHVVKEEERKKQDSEPATKIESVGIDGTAPEMHIGT